jgi:hypothetical protein
LSPGQIFEKLPEIEHNPIFSNNFTACPKKRIDPLPRKQYRSSCSKSGPAVPFESEKFRFPARFTGSANVNPHIPPKCGVSRRREGFRGLSRRGMPLQSPAKSLCGKNFQQAVPCANF